MTPMTEEWVSLWYQCLTQNIDYSLYCEARASGNEARCATYEARFDRIRDIYDDFGTLEAWPDAGLQSALWREWFEPRRHLFLNTARLVEDPSTFAPRQGCILVEVPLQADARQSSAAVSELLRSYFESHSPGRSAPAPKYALRENAKQRPAVGIETVRKACRSVLRSYVFDPETFEYRTQRDAHTEFIRNELEAMGWKLDPKARSTLLEEGTLSEQRYDMFRTMLNRCRRQFKLLAANTIRGSFPDERPFASSVVDEF